MSGNIKTLNSSNQENNVLFEEWHKEHSKKIAHCTSTSRHYKNIKNRFILLGTPNVGKSTFFNKLTTGNAVVSNIDRMTVEDTIGHFRHDKQSVLVDLPGIYNLSHPLDEEMVVAHEIYHEHYDKIVNIIGAQSIERDLLLTVQLLESGMLSTVIVNMIDEVTDNSINSKKLSQCLNNVPIIFTQANRGIGMDKAENSILHNIPVKALNIKYPQSVESSITKLIPYIPSRNINQRFFALMLLEGNSFFHNALKKNSKQKYAQISKILKRCNLSKMYDLIYQTRKNFIKTIIDKSASKLTLKTSKKKQWVVDSHLLNKWIGVPALFIIMAIVYYLAFGPYAGGFLRDQLDWFLNVKLAQDWIHNGLFGHITNDTGSWFANLFSYGLLSGFFTVITFIPVIVILFICVNLIQQIGVLSRISVLLDGTLERFGISGRSVVNLLTGFGCNVPSIMMARSSSSRKERIVSIIIAPFIACSARVIVFSFVCNAMFTNQFGWIAMILLTIASGLFALLVGLIFSNTLFRKQKSFFMIEMVDWRKPDFMVIAKSVWLQLKEFIKKAALLITVASVLIWIILHIGVTNHTLLKDKEIDHSLLAYFAKGINYAMYPVGFGSDPDGWKMTASLISAIPAKEIALANLQMLFHSNPSPSDFFSHHLAMGMSYLVITMLYFPCSATLATMKKESSWRIVGLHIGTSLTIAYVSGIIVYWMTCGLLLI